MLRFGPSFALATALLATATVLATGPAAAADELSYNRDIRSILVENCFSCHGADSAGRKADLRLDERDQAVESGALVPGDPDSSVMLDRIFSDDPEEVMPPPETKKSLTAAQKELLVRWIKEGAEYEPHWSFIPPAKPEPPAVKGESWVRNPIDRFILAGLEAAGLTPAPEADRRTLARRAALDVTGLPPDPAAVEAFLADTRPDAYERYLDVLFASPEWGEHRGRHWLDYARYADTHGIHFDNHREMWTYRQWVIQAFNDNLPFDRFTELQLAGDLVDLPSDASPDEVLQARIGSGFNRCNMTTNEGGIIDEEYVVLYARDRTETTATVWMGLTVGCAVCHDHKFDPVSAKDFYSLSAFFNNTTQGPRDGNVKDTPPILTVAKQEDRPRLAELERALPIAKRTVTDRRAGAKPAFEAFLAAATPETVRAMLPADTPLVSLSFAEGEGSKTRVNLLGKQADLPLSETISWQAGPAGRPAVTLDGKAAELASAGDFEHDQPFTVSCWLKPPANDTFYAVAARLDEAANHRGWDLFVQGRRAGMHLIHAWADDALKVVAESQLPADAWTLVTLTYDGSGKAEGVRVYYDGKPQKLKLENNKFKRNSIKTAAPLTIGSRTPGGSAHGVGLADLAIHGRALSEVEVLGIAQAATLATVVKLPPAERAKAGGSLYDWWLGAKDDAFIAATKTVAGLEAEIAGIKARGTIAHVMHEKDGMPMAHVLDRGEYDKKKEEVAAGTPAALPPFPDHLPRSRLGLARWLLLPEHPLTARVTVNRFWQEVFGTGLVRTAGDFGITGELPSHPELLDWLAVEFRESGWDVKRMYRTLVLSATYRQSARVRPGDLQKDPANRFLARGPRYRMDGEVLRDSALAAAGLLSSRLGGPPVRPYQPGGLWEEVAMPESNTRTYIVGHGDQLYRRSVYTFWKRSSPPPAFETFDSPSRELACVRRPRSNTPLQAFVTMNDRQWIEASRKLAERVLLSGHSSTEARLQALAGFTLGRPLSAREKGHFQPPLEEFVSHYRADANAAILLLGVGDSSVAPGVDTAELAAWTMVASQFLNLDEFLTK